MAFLGSGEFQPWAEPVDRRLIEGSRTGSDRVLILPTAAASEGDDVFDRWGEMGIAHYQRIGARAEVVPVRTRDDADDPGLASRVAGAALIFFSGGNPAYLCRTLRGSRFWQAVLDAVARGTSFGGCSAGAVMLGPTVPDTTSSELSLDVWTEGLNYFPRLLFGAHWDVLDTFRPGFTEEVLRAIPNGCTFVAIDEETAVVGDGAYEVMGRGRVIVHVPGQEARVLRAGDTLVLDG